MKKKIGMETFGRLCDLYDLSPKALNTKLVEIDHLLYINKKKPSRRPIFSIKQVKTIFKEIGPPKEYQDENYLNLDEG